MTKEQAIEMVLAAQRADPVDADKCTEAAAALVDAGLVRDDGESFEPNWDELKDLPKDVQEFISGMMIWNNEEKEH